MLLKSSWAVCIALSLVTTVSSRATAPRSLGCSKGNCDIEALAQWQQSAALNEPSIVATASEKRSLVLAPEVLPRAAPVVIPKLPPAPKGPKPNLPGKTPPKKPPTTGGKGSDDADAEIAAKACPHAGDGLILRSPCHPGSSGDSDSEGGGFGNNPAVDHPAPSRPDGSNPPPFDYFAEVKGPNPRENAAKRSFDDRIALDEADDAIPEIADVDKSYSVFKDDEMTDVLTGERAEQQELLEKAGITFDRKGTYFSVNSQPKPGAIKPFHDVSLHECTYSNDGKVIFAEYNHKANDFTPADSKLPWFKMVMHVRSKRLPGNPDPKELQAIARVAIDNPDTVKTIDSIFAALKAKTNELVVISAKAAAGTDEAAAFEAFMKTDNGRGAYWLLGTYHKAFGNKVVSRIILRKENEATGRNAAALIVFDEAA